ncbi:hypothetical protein JOD64_005361 [Micromonospora luteifusca]|uniref:Uncharacterized protein n=1 Tax=Micromonospora luteifusca TaxID=709860 RepID=A0ABS2M1X5_9ACTN|nr:hypothetical protein [Micromonospora luteifusca]
MTGRISGKVVTPTRVIQPVLRQVLEPTLRRRSPVVIAPQVTAGDLPGAGAVENGLLGPATR